MKKSILLAVSLAVTLPVLTTIAPSAAAAGRWCGGGGVFTLPGGGLRGGTLGRAADIAAHARGLMKPSPVMMHVCCLVASTFRFAGSASPDAGSRGRAGVAGDEGGGRAAAELLTIDN